MKIATVLIVLSLAVPFAYARPADCAARLKQAAARSEHARQALQAFQQSTTARVRTFTEGIFDTQSRLRTATGKQKTDLEARLKAFQDQRKAYRDEEARLVGERKAAETDEERVERDCR